MNETAQVEKQKVYEAHTAVNQLKTVIQLYDRAIIGTPHIAEVNKLPDPGEVAELLTLLVNNAMEKMEIVLATT